MSASDSILLFHLPAGVDKRGPGWYWRLPEAEKSVGPYETREEAHGEAQDCADDYDATERAKLEKNLRHIWRQLGRKP